MTLITSRASCDAKNTFRKYTFRKYTFENTLSENTLSENTLSENTLSENTLLEFTILEIILSEITLSEKTTVAQKCSVAMEKYDQRTNGPTDGRTDKASYRDAWTHLKTRNQQTDYPIKIRGRI